MDRGPSPRIVVAKMVTLISENEKQSDDEISKISLQFPPTQLELGIMTEPQSLPEVESV